MGGQPKANASPRVLFGPFEYDGVSGELRKHGTRIRLQGQPLQILFALLERPGEIVSREDLKGQLWPDAAFGDFEHGLHAAVNKLRQALGDSADQPRYVETLPGRGYRFIAPVQRPSLTTVLVRPALQVEQKPLPPPSRRILPWACAAVVTLIAAVSLALLWRTTRPVNRPLVKLSIELPGFAITTVASPGASLALSPDGTRVVYTGRSADGIFRLYTRTLDQEQPVPLAGTDGAYGPFFSPNGQVIGFFAGGQLKKIPVDRGVVVVLCLASKGAGGSWGEDGNIIAGLGNGILSRVPSGGGLPQPVTELSPQKNDLLHMWPQVLPGAQAVLFTTYSTNGEIGDATIEVQSLRTGERKTLMREGYYGRYVPSGHLLYMQGRTLYAVPMDAKLLALTGPAAPVIEEIATGGDAGYAHVAFSENGTFIYVQAKPVKQALWWLDSSGRMQPLPATPAEYNPAVRFSPDGRRLAVASFGDGTIAIGVYGWEQNILTRLTFKSFAWFPVWSPDGKHIAFMMEKTEGFNLAGGPWSSRAPNLYYMRSDGIGEPVPLTESNNRQVPYSFSPDGKRLAFFEFNPRTKADIWTLPIESPESDHPKPGKPEPFLVTPADERAPMISPDGRWIAYESDESGRNEVYVRSFPGPAGLWQISTEGGDRPVWSKKNRELFYRSGEGMMVADYTPNGEAFGPGKPRLWAAKKDLGSYFDLAPDGKRFAVLQPVAEQSSPEHVMLLQNFFDELRRRTPGGNK